MTEQTPGIPNFEGSELHLHISGAVSAALVPWWIHWLRHTSPDATVNASISRRAERFVVADAVRELANGEVWIDDWDQRDLPKSWRSGKTGNSECIIVFPATLDTIMRLSQGRADSPAMMMMQITELPIVIADVMPAENEVVSYWREILTKRTNVHFAPHLEGVRAVDRSVQSNGFNLPGAIAIANQQIRRSADGNP